MPFFKNIIQLRRKSDPVLKYDLYSWGTGQFGQLDNSLVTISPTQLSSNTYWSAASLGSSYSMAIRTDGTLWGWGVNTANQIGSTNTLNQSSPIQIGTDSNWSKVIAATSQTLAIKSNGTLWGMGPRTAGITGVVPNQPYPLDYDLNTAKASAGGQTTFIIKTDGTLWACGNGGGGILGIGDTNARSSPVQIGTDTNWTSVAAGFYHTLAIKTNGTLWGWGSNAAGQLGDNSAVTRSSPVQIGADTNWSSIAAGIEVSLAIKTNGTLWSWGYNLYGSLALGNTINRSSPVQIGTDTSWSTVSSNGYQVLALKTNGTLWAWGYNGSGQLGLGDTIDRSSPIQVGSLNTWTRIDGGNQSSYAIRSDGSLWSWGLNNNGQLGLGDTAVNRSSPVQVGTETYNWKNVSAGTVGYCMAIKNDDSLWAWGFNTEANLGIGNATATSSPVQIGYDERGYARQWSAVYGGYSHTVAISSNQIFTWGGNTWGELGTGNTLLGTASAISSIQTPTAFISPRKWSSIKIDGGTSNHVLGLATDGTLWGWGSNANGQLGVLDTINKSYPIQIGPDSNWAYVANGPSFSVGVKTDGTLWSWGLGSGNQLGQGLNLPSWTVDRTSAWTGVAAGPLTSFARKSDGSLWTWGNTRPSGVREVANGPIPVGSDSTWATMSFGNSTSMAIKSDGTLWGWGGPWYALGVNLGVSTNQNRSSPVQIGTLSNWSKVYTTNQSTFAIKTDGSLWSWGINNAGQLGDGTVVSRSSPVQVGTMTNWSLVSTGGGSATMAIKTDGTLWSWGFNASGQLGLGDTANRSSPVQVGTLTGWSNISSGFSGAVAAIRTNGTLWTWGVGTNGQLGRNDQISRSSPVQVGVDTNWASVVVGQSHTMAVRTNGTLWTWGINTLGQLGSNNVTARSSPVQVGTLTTWSTAANAISTWINTSYALTTSGILWSWGENSNNGQVGDKSIINRSSPVQVGTLSWSMISAGNTHVGGISSGGIYAWGLNLAGQLGQNNTIALNSTIFSPVRVGRENYWTNNISAGFSHTLAVTTAGTLFAWGNNASGEVGDNTVVTVWSPTQIGASTNWTSVAGMKGMAASFAINSLGGLWAWGVNTTGQLGDNTTISRSSPVQIGANVWSKVETGSSHTMAIRTDGTLWAWGLNSLAQLGLGDIASRSSPVQVGTLGGWIDATGGGSHTIAVRSNGTLWGWGSNSTGQLGIDLYFVTGQVGALSDWNSANSNAEGNFVIAKKNDGSIWSWGLNNSGMLGLGDTASRSSPVQIGTLTDWSIAITGSSHVLAIKTNGTIWSWGNNGNGQLGQSISTAINRSSPVQIGTDSNWGSVHTTAITSFGIKTNGTLWGWGFNTFGQIGDGTTADKSSPVQIGTNSNWSKVVGGTSHTIALTTDGRLFSWGAGDLGVLGLNDVINRSSPVQIGTSTNWYDIASGADFVIALTNNGNLWGWGANSSLVISTTAANRSSPVQIGSDGDWNLSYITAGGQSNTTTGFIQVIKSNGSLWGWGTGGYIGTGGRGLSSPIQVSSSLDWSNVDAGRFASVAVKTNGTIWTWGLNDHGQLAKPLDNSLIATTSRALSPIQIGSDTNWFRVYAGGDRSIALKTNGTLWAWGSIFSWPGFDGIVNRSSPVQIGSFTDWTSVIAESTSHTVAVKSDGTLRVWGGQAGGSTGRPDPSSGVSSPIQVGDDNSWTKVVAKQSYTIALKSNGTLWGWGVGSSGQLAQFNTTGYGYPVQIGGFNPNFWELPPLTDTWADATVSMTPLVHALRSNGTLWGWGQNTIGQLGDLGFVNRSSPVQIGSGVSTLPDNQGTTVSAVIRTDNTMWVWGFPSSNLGAGELGYTFQRSSPVQVGSQAGWQGVYSTSFSTLSIKTDGSLWSWGRNDQGQGGINNSTITGYASPTQIGSDTNWQKLAVAVEGAIGIKTNGTLWAWGLNGSGQLGLGDSILRSSPVQIGLMNNWSDVEAIGNGNVALKTDGSVWMWGVNSSNEIAAIIPAYPQKLDVDGTTPWSSSMAGFSHTMAIKTDGTLWGWGSNTQGELGDSTAISRSSPVQIGTLTTWNNAKLSPNVAFTTAIKSDGTLWGWGINNNGQLGNNSVVTRSSPVQIGTLTNWSKISSGYSHTMAIKTDGTLWAWGLGTSGQLGDNTAVTKSSPVQIGLGTDWSVVSAAGNFTLAIKTGGTLWSWGAGTNGQLGSGLATNRSSPVQVGTLTNWSDVRGGANHSIAIKTDGTLWAWGLGTSGQLGDNTAVSRSSPVQIGTLTTWSSVGFPGSAMGQAFSAATRTDGSLWTWGVNSAGQIGDLGGVSRSSPVQISSGGTWQNFSLGGLHMLATLGNALYLWGLNSSGQLGFGNVVQAGSTSINSPIMLRNSMDWQYLAKGRVNTRHSFLIKTNGTLWGWGSNAAGQLGDNSAVTRSSPVQIGSGIPWSKVAVGASTTMALATDGTLWTWGANTNGQLGQTAVTMSNIDRNNVWTSVSTGISFTIALKSNGTIWTWGQNANGELGLGDTINRSSPVQVGTLTNWSKVRAGNQHCAALKTDGTIWAWGNNGVGQLGVNDLVARSSPIQIGTDTNWSEVYVGMNTTYAKKTNGSIWGWGFNGQNQLGNGTFTSVSSPIQIGTDTNWSTLSASQETVLAIKTNGTLWGWGNNSYYQLTYGVNGAGSPVQIGTLSNWAKVESGGGSGGAWTVALQTNGTLWAWGNVTSGRTGVTIPDTPQMVGSENYWQKIAAHILTAVAIKTDGTLWTWGYNQDGQVGDNSTATRSSPVQVGSSNDWSKLQSNTSQGYSLAAIKTDGTLWMWGKNDFGQLGQSNTVSRSSPVQVGLSSDWNEVSCGLSHTIALKSNGTLWGWGLNNAGQIGNNSTTNTSSPVQIGTLTNWSKISSGGSQTMAIKTDSTLWAWGQNAFGQLGDGTTVPRSSPVQIGTLGQWADVYSGASHTMAIRTDGTLWAWGFNGYRQVTPTDTNNRSSPVQIGSLNTWSAISTSSSSMFIQSTTGTTWTWGQGGYGELGLGIALTNVQSPTFLSSEFSRIAAGEGFTLAIRRDGSLFSWGYNGWGSLGLNLNTNLSGNSSYVSYPTQIGSSNSWNDISASPYNGSTLGRRTDNTLWAWGDNSFGQIGVGDFSVRSSPVQIASSYNWNFIESGFANSFAIDSNGRLWGCGTESVGQLGRGFATAPVPLAPRSLPIQVGDSLWKDIVEGTDFSAAIKTDGSLWAWGLNTSGQLGNLATTSTVSYPIQVGRLKNWEYVDAGDAHGNAVAKSYT